MIVENKKGKIKIVDGLHKAKINNQPLGGERERGKKYLNVSDVAIHTEHLVLGQIIAILFDLVRSFVFNIRIVYFHVYVICFIHFGLPI